MLQSYAATSRHADSKCKVHARGANKTVRATHAAAYAALAAAGMHVTWYQEWPLRHGLQRRTIWVDLVFQLGARVYGIEVHGGKEHVHQPGRRRRDELKQSLWWRQYGTELIVIHSTSNLRLCALQRTDWDRYVQERVMAAVRPGGQG